jgi:hypothetical protein
VIDRIFLRLGKNVPHTLLGVEKVEVILQLDLVLQGEEPRLFSIRWNHLGSPRNSHIIGLECNPLSALRFGNVPGDPEVAQRPEPLL